MMASAVALADAGISLWPVESFGVLLGGVLALVLALVTGGAMLARTSRSQEVRRLEAKVEAYETEREQTAPAEGTEGKATSAAMRSWSAESTTGHPRERDPAPRESKEEQVAPAEPGTTPAKEQDA
jgi:hypothetical protein